MSPNSSRPFSVYIARDKFGAILYVGITSSALIRLVAHARLSEWWPFVASQQIEHHASRPAALERETMLIRMHRPPFNVAQNEGHENLRAAYYRLRGLPTPTRQTTTSRDRKPPPVQRVPDSLSPDATLMFKEAAAYAGKTPAAWKKARQRRPCPPDGHFGRTPWWYPSTIDKWLPNTTQPTVRTER